MKTKYLWISAFCIASLFSSCKKYLDINTNPSYPQDVKAELLIAPIIYQMANGYMQDSRMMNKFTQNILGASTDLSSFIWERHGYPVESDVGGVMWRMVYYDHGHNLRLMIEDGIKNEKYEYAAIGYAIKAWGYQMLTDYHGPIILNDALKQDLLKFTYQEQDEVYAKVREWCDSSLFYLAKESPLNYSANLNSIKGDNLYRGNKERWKKFIYGLKAMQYGRLVNKAAYKTNYADSIIKYVDLSFASTADDAGVKFAGANSSNSNVISAEFGFYTSVYYNRAGLPVLRYLTGGLRGDPIEESKGSIDPRLSRMLNFRQVDSVYIAGTPLVSNTTVPNILGVIQDNVYPGKYIFKKAQDFPIMTYAQLQLIKAEAAFIKNDKATAYEAYIRAILGHMDFVNKYAQAGNSGETAITQADVTSYLESDEIPQSAADLTLADIMGQKYIVQWGYGALEQWSDIRKYNYDPLVFRQFVQLQASQLEYQKYSYRVRPRYNSEFIWNSAELEKWGGLEPDYVTKPVWFVLSDN